MSMNGMLRTGRGCAVVCALALAVGVAKADLPEIMFEVTAEVGPLSVTVPIYTEWGDYDPETGTWSWELSEAMEFWYDTTFLGVLNEMSATVVADPEVNLNFAVQSGSAATEFYIASQELTFDTMYNAEGRASAAYSLTDFDGNSAALTGIGATGGAYLAQYNGWAGNPAGPDGTTFAEGIYSMSAGFLETVTADFQEPASGFASIPDPVDSMSALVSFELSAYDQASGTSIFVIVPEPCALALLGLGSLALLRRRS